MLTHLDNFDGVLTTIENVFKCYSSRLAPYTRACFYEILADVLHAGVSCGQRGNTTVVLLKRTSANIN